MMTMANFIRATGASVILSAMLATAPDATAQVTLYEEAGFGGSLRYIVRDTPNLGPHRFANETWSLKILSGTWEFFHRPDYEGRSVTLGPGEYSSISAIGMRNNELSSIRLKAGELPPNVASVTLYENPEFRGSRRDIIADTARFSLLEFNNETESLRVNSGRWALFEDRNFLGDSITVGPGEYPNLSSLDFPNNQLSSIRLVGPADALPPKPKTVATPVAAAPAAPAKVATPSAPAIVTAPLAPAKVTTPSAPAIVATPPAPATMTTSQVAGATIVNRANGWCIDGASPGGPLQLVPCSGAASQRFSITAGGQIRASGNRCLDVQGGAVLPGAFVDLTPCRSAAAQTWRVQRDGQIVGVNARCLGWVRRGATSQLALQPCDVTGDSQRWLLRQVAAASSPTPAAATTGATAPATAGAQQAATPTAAARDIMTPVHGRAASLAPIYDLDCGPQGTLVGLNGSVGARLDRLRAVCGAFGRDGSLTGARLTGYVGGDTVAENSSIKCPAGQAVSGIYLGFADVVHYIGIYCRSIGTNGRLSGIALRYGAVGATDPGVPLRQANNVPCPADRPAKGLRVAARQAVENVRLICNYPTAP